MVPVVKDLKCWQFEKLIIFLLLPAAAAADHQTTTTTTNIQKAKQPTK